MNKIKPPNIKVKIFLFLILGVSLTMGLVYAVIKIGVEPTSGWQSYKNYNLNFSIKYPVGWYTLESPAGTGSQQNLLGTVLFSNVPPENLSSPKKGKAIYVVSTRVDSDWSLEKWAKETTQGENAILVESKREVVDNLPALRQVTAITDIEGKFWMTMVLVKTNNVGWGIYTLRPDSDKKFNPEFEHMLSTFKVLRLSFPSSVQRKN